MEKLSDDEILIIFKLLNLNERTSIRSVCRRFKVLINSIKLNELVLFDILKPIAGKKSR